MDTFEHDLNRYLKTQEDAANYDEYIDDLTDKKWSEIVKEVTSNLESPNSWCDEYTVARTIKGKQIESACCFADLIREHIDSDRLQRILSVLIASPAGAEFRTALAHLHAASHSRNLADADNSY